MRTRIPILILLSFLVASFSANAERKAFLVCISEYANGTGWNRISADNDLILLQQSLASDFEIDSIANEDATYANVVSFLNGITTKVFAKDTVLILFSCHGQQMLTVNDLSEPDGLDEAIITFDANMKYSDQYHGENHLRDDDLEVILNQIRTVLGNDGLLMVLFDACHSDSMYRGEKIVRGSADIFGPPVEEEVLDSLKRIRYAQDTVSLSDGPGLSKAVYLSACRASKKNKEVVINEKGYGSLSYAFASAYNNHQGLADLSAVLSDIQVWMKKHAQEPVFHSSYPISLDNNNEVDSVQEDNTCSMKPVFLFIAAFAIITTLVLCLIRLIKKNGRS